MTSPETASAPNPLSSDIPAPTTNNWLEEPTKPKPEDFKNPENFEFAFNEYKQKLTTYQARVRLHKSCVTITAEQEKADKDRIEFEKTITFIENELGPMGWGYAINEEQPFRAAELASHIMSRTEYSVITDKSSEVVYLYVDKLGIYRKDGEQILRHLIDKALENESTTHRINETINLLKIRTYAAITQSKKIAVLNGLLDIETGHINPFTKYEFVTNKLNAEYKEGIRSEAWEKFIAQICPDDKDLLQEWSGYLLIKGYPYHAIMWFYGPRGRNGKGVWARTMQAILTEINYSAVSIDEFDGKHRFAVFSLHDSLFNICSEPRTDRTLTVEKLQELTGQDSIDAERKGVQERFKFRNQAKMTVMGNKFPNFDKPTDAFWERLKLIKFPFRFVGSDQIPDIENTWLKDPEQVSGILNWMIEGARRLIQNKGKFTETKSQEDTIIQFKRASDHISAFIAECLKFDSNSVIAKIKVYEYYKQYCEVINVQSESNTVLNEKLNSEAKIKPVSARLEIGSKKQTKSWKGIVFKPLPEAENSDEDSDEEDTEQSTTPLAETKQITLPTCESVTDVTEITDYSAGIENDSDKTLISKSKSGNSGNTGNIEEAKSQLKVVAEDSGLRRLEANNLVNAKRFKPTAGVLCTHIDQDVPCVKEAEYSINGNLYCPTDYEAEKENLRKIGKIVCAEWVAEAA